MQKVLDFLEKHVQWVALGIAALFFVYALVSYMPFVTHPVTLELDNQQLTPGEVDPVIRSRAEELEQRITSAQPVRVPVPNFVEQFNGAVATLPVKPTLLPAYQVAFKPIKYPPNFDPNAAPEQGGTSVTLVEALPTLPSPIMEPVPTTSFAQVTVPAPGQPAATPTAQPVQPGTTGTAAAGAPATDIIWVRVPFTISMASVSQQFRNARIPPTWANTAFLRVELIRQKQLPGDQYGPEEVVPALPHLALMPMPAEGPAAANAQQQYVAWANANQGPIVQPEFFQVIAGADPRMTLPDEAATAAAAAEVFDPEMFPINGDVSKLTEEQRRAVMEVRRRRAAEREANKPRGPAGGGGMPTSGGGGRGGGGGGGGGGRGGGGASPYIPYLAPAATEASTSIVTFQVRTGGGYPAGGADPGYPGGAYPGAGGMSPVGGEGAPGAAAPQVIAVNPVPPAPFDPAQVTGGQIEGWAYDTTATPDTTYRYRIRYALRNPIYGTQNVAATPALAQQFAIYGGEAQPQWTDPITIAPLTHIFLERPPVANAGSVRFVVYRWQAGQRHRASFTVQPGDSIGRKEGDVDYRTLWTLVEVRKDTSSPAPYAVLMNAEGIIRRQSFETDSSSAIRQKLEAEVNGGVVPPPPGMGPVPPGGPGGRPPPGIGGRPGSEGPIP